MLDRRYTCYEDSGKITVVFLKGLTVSSARAESELLYPEQDRPVDFSQEKAALNHLPVGTGTRISAQGRESL